MAEQLVGAVDQVDLHAPSVTSGGGRDLGSLQRVTTEPATPAAAVPAARWTAAGTVLQSAGLVTCGAGAILMAAAAGHVMTEQSFGPGGAAGGSIELASDVVGVGAALAVICFAAAFAPWSWARLTGLAAGSATSGIAALILIGARTDDRYISGIDVSLGTGGWLLLAASALALTGVTLTLAGLAGPASSRPEAADDRVSGKAVASLVLGICGFLVVPLAAVAAGLGLVALREVPPGRDGRGLGIAGLVLGLVAQAAWGLGLLAGALLVQP